MKKRFLSLIVAICFIIPGCILLSACGEQDKTIYVGKEKTLAEAVQNAKDGDILKLDQDITLENQVNINKRITLDLNNFTINNTKDIWNDPDTSVANSNDAWSLVSVKENGDLTIKNGTLKAKENDCYAIDVRGGNVTIESGTYTGNISAVYVTEGEVLITGGKFNVQQQDPNFEKGKFTINAKDANAGTSAIIKIQGGEFANFNPTEFIENNYEVTQSQADTNGDIWYTVSKK